MTAFRYSRPLILTLMLLCVVCGARAQKGRQPDARAVVRKMAESYAACKSYQDTGVVETIYREETGGRIDKMPFKTYFKRPNLLRFEWVDYYPWKTGRTSVVWSDGTGTFTYWEPDRFEKDEDVSMGIAGATGVSHGAAHTLPRLLLPREIGGFALTDLKDLTLAGEEVFEGEPCYKVTGKDKSGDVHELWISKKEFLLRKERTETPGFDGGMVTEEEIHRNIKINQPIADEVFKFKPPIPLSADKEPLPDKSPLTDEAPTWTEFYSEEGRFKVLLPDKPTTQTLTLESPKGQIVHHGFIASKGGTFCIIDYADVPRASAADAAQVKELFDTARDEFIKGVEGKLVSETVISLDGHPGREVVADLGSGGKGRARFYLINERFYQLAVMQLQFRLPGEPAAEDHAAKFFASFKLVGDIKRVAALPRLY